MIFLDSGFCFLIRIGQSILGLIYDLALVCISITTNDLLRALMQFRIDFVCCLYIHLFTAAPVHAYFKLQKPVPELIQHIEKLEYDIYEEIGVPNTKVVHPTSAITLCIWIVILCEKFI